MPSAALASMIASTRRARSDGRSPMRSSITSARSPMPAPNSNGATSTAVSAVASVTHVISALCIGSTSSGPSRKYARPGRWRLISAALRSPITSVESAASCTRSAIRRLVLVRMWSLTTPAGRCVARIRCTPSVRPRWATSTSAASSSGCSRAILANSSITTTSRGMRLVVRALVVGAHVVGLGAAQQPLAVLQLGLQGPQRALDERLVEVGDHPDGVRQARARVERGAALEVHQQERELARVGGGGERGDQAAQQLALARAGRPADERVRPVALHVEAEDALLGHAHRAGGRRGHPGALPAAADRLGGHGVELEQRQQAHAVGQPGAGDAQLGVLEAGEVARAAARGGEREAGDDQLLAAVAGVRAVRDRVAVRADDLDHRVAGRRQAVAGARDDDARDRQAVVGADAVGPRARRAAARAPGSCGPRSRGRSPAPPARCRWPRPRRAGAAAPRCAPAGPIATARRPRPRCACAAATSSTPSRARGPRRRRRRPSGRPGRGAPRPGRAGCARRRARGGGRRRCRRPRPWPARRRPARRAARRPRASSTPVPAAWSRGCRPPGARRRRRARHRG